MSRGPYRLIVQAIGPNWETRCVTSHNDQTPEQPSRLTFVDISQLLDEAAPTLLPLIMQNVDILACVADELALHGSNLHVEVAHAAETFHEDTIPMEVLIGRIGGIAEGELKGVGVVVVVEGFEVQLAAGEEQAVFLGAGHVCRYHVYDVFVEEHVGVDLVPDLQGEREECS